MGIDTAALRKKYYAAIDGPSNTIVYDGLVIQIPGLCDEIDRLCIGWRPIESAPKDGTIIDVWLEGEKSDIQFYCDSPIQKSKHIFAGRSAGWHWIGGKWRPKLGLGMSVPIFIEPTHWQPLPEPPK